MSERLTIPARRTITPVAAFLMVIALTAALALGFGLRTWTEGSPGSSGSVGATHQQISNPRDEAALRTVTVTRRTTESTLPLPVRRIGKPW